MAKKRRNYVLVSKLHDKLRKITAAENTRYALTAMCAERIGGRDVMTACDGRLLAQISSTRTQKWPNDKGLIEDLPEPTITIELPIAQLRRTCKAVATINGGDLPVMSIRANEKRIEVGATLDANHKDNMATGGLGVTIYSKGNDEDDSEFVITTAVNPSYLDSLLEIAERVWKIGRQKKNGRIESWDSTPTVTLEIRGKGMAITMHTESKTGSDKFFGMVMPSLEAEVE